MTKLDGWQMPEELCPNCHNPLREHWRGRACVMPNPQVDHHPWCNYWGRPRAGCKQCEGLYERYPLTPGESLDLLQQKHFPNVIKIP
jgi:hypothetical protein